jgi:hypothetical protein
MSEVNVNCFVENPSLDKLETKSINQSINQRERKSISPFKVNGITQSLSVLNDLLNQ